MTFDANRLKFGDLIAGGGAVVLFISLFLDWYNVTIQGAGKLGDLGGGNAFDALGIGPVFLLLVSLAVIAIVIVRSRTGDAPAARAAEHDHPRAGRACRALCPVPPADHA
jgi:hypothetical protein